MSDVYVIGCDPDSAGNGIAVYCNGMLQELKNLGAVDFYCRYKRLKGEDVTFVIENVKGNKSVFRAAYAKNKSDAGAKGKSVGMCMQAQAEIERAVNLLGFKIVYRPRSSKWKKGPQAEEFKRCTGWKGRSNEDTRSAAWMGYQVL
jgi:hypothetical protein